MNEFSKQVVLPNDPRLSQMNQAFLLQKKNSSKIIKAIKYMDSQDPSVVVKGLNILTQKSFEMMDTNALHLDNFPELVLSLGSLLDVVNPCNINTFIDTPYKTYNSMVLDRSNVYWNSNSIVDIFQKQTAMTFDSSPLLLTILNILRNLSFESSNEFLLSSSTPIMRQLVSIVIASVVHNISSEASQLALDVLVCVGGRVDTTGRRRLQPNAYLEEVRSDDKKATMLLRLSAHMSAASTLEYVNATSRLFPLLLYTLEETSTASSLRQSKFPSRFYVVRALELLSKLILVPENLVTVCRSPDSLLRALVDLLCVSISSLEPIVPESSALAGDPAGRLRPPAVLLTSSSSGAGGVSMGSSFNAQAALQATSSYFHQEHCDLELRDLSMDCLHSLCAVSVAMQLRLADIPDAVQLIYRIANLSATATASGVGSSSTNTFSRTEGTSKAALVLALLFAQPELRSKYFSIRTNLIVSACSDETLSDVVCNKVNPLFHRPSLLQQTLLPPLDVSDTQSSAMVL